MSYIEFEPKNWNLSVDGSGKTNMMNMSAKMNLSDIFGVICDHYNLHKELLPHQDHYGVWIIWNKENGHVKKKEDISHHGSSDWREFDSYDLSEKENQILLKMNELIEMLESTEEE